MAPARQWTARLLALGGIALLAWYVQRLGLERVSTGLSAVGVGFVGILVLAFLRYVARARAWRALIRQPTRFRSVLVATIAGDALGPLTPMGALASEPAKALYLDRDVATEAAGPALAAENYFYLVSVVGYMMLGAALMLASFPVPAAVYRIGLGSLGAFLVFLAFAGWLAYRRPRDTSTSTLSSATWRGRFRGFEAQTYRAVSAGRGHLGTVALGEVAFHVLSFSETWLTLALLTGRSLPIHALALDTFNRISNIAFRLVPLRLGVDQAGTGFVAGSIGLDPGTGVMLSLVRTIRTAIWVAIGVGLLALRARAHRAHTRDRTPI